MAELDELRAKTPIDPAPKSFRDDREDTESESDSLPEKPVGATYPLARTLPDSGKLGARIVSTPASRANILKALNERMRFPRFGRKS